MRGSSAGLIVAAVLFAIVVAAIVSHLIDNCEGWTLSKDGTTLCVDNDNIVLIIEPLVIEGDA